VEGVVLEREGLVEGRDLVDDGEGADKDAAGWLAGVTAMAAAAAAVGMVGMVVVSVQVVVLVVVVHVEVEVGGIHDDQVVDNV
jgi:hypothetical protein